MRLLLGLFRYDEGGPWGVGHPRLGLKPQCGTDCLTEPHCTSGGWRRRGPELEPDEVIIGEYRSRSGDGLTPVALFNLTQSLDLLGDDSSSLGGDAAPR